MRHVTRFQYITQKSSITIRLIIHLTFKTKVIISPGLNWREEIITKVFPSISFSF